MAKISMVCPFSKKACKECSFYRGRHYYICYPIQYKRYLLNPTILKFGENLMRGVMTNKEEYRK
jgi:hypothetical protein